MGDDYGFGPTTDGIGGGSNGFNPYPRSSDHSTHGTDMVGTIRPEICPTCRSWVVNWLTDWAATDDPVLVFRPLIETAVADGIEARDDVTGIADRVLKVLAFRP